MSKKRVSRFDYGTVTSAERTPQGYLRAPVKATRIGVFSYRMADGTLLRELRTPEEVFKEESLRSLAGVPITDDHPPVVLLDTRSTRHYQRGCTGDAITHDDRYVEAVATVMDEELITKVLDEGKREVSCGYTCELDFTPGVTADGEEYDCIQRKIVYNHLAVVDRGRAGPAVRLKLDQADPEMGVQVDSKSNPKRKEEKSMKKVKLGSKEFECEDALADAIQANVDAHEAELKKARESATTEKTRADAAEKARDTAQAQADQAKSEVEKARVDAAQKPALKAALKERRALEKVAESVLDSKELEKLDEMENQDVMKAVIMSQRPEAKLDGKSDAYIQASFDAIKESLDESDEAKRELGKKIAGNKDSDEGKTRADADAARKKAMDEAKDAWKQPLAKSSSK